jgi:hypothetical protein
MKDTKVKYRNAFLGVMAPWREKAGLSKLPQGKKIGK